MLFKYKVLKYIKKKRRATRSEIIRKFKFSEKEKSYFSTLSNPDPHYLMVYDNGKMSDNIDDCISYEITGEGESYLESVSREIAIAAVGVFATVAVSVLTALLQDEDISGIIYEAVRNILSSSPQ